MRLARGERERKRAGRLLTVVASLLTAFLVAGFTPAAHAAVQTTSRAAGRQKLLTLWSPSRVTEGAAVRLSGRLISPTHPGLAGRKINFYERVPGGRGWTKIGQRITGAGGYYSKKLRAPLTYEPDVAYYARYSGGGWSTNSLTERVRLRTPADGTSYWGEDSCRYYVSQRTWHGDICTATEGTGIYDVYQFDNRAAHDVGALEYQFYTKSAGFIVWRQPFNSVFQFARWAAVPVDDPTAEVQYYIDWDGQWQWTTVSQLQTLLADLEALLAALTAQGQPATSNEIVTVGGAGSTPAALTDFANGVDTLGGNAELGAVFSNIHSLGTTEPITPGVCGEVGYYCYPGRSSARQLTPVLAPKTPH